MTEFVRVKSWTPDVIATGDRLSRAIDTAALLLSHDMHPQPVLRQLLDELTALAGDLDPGKDNPR